MQGRIELARVPAVLAHRGIVPGYRENTIDAFAAALQRGADGVELDVRPSRDGALVVHHDAVVAGSGPVRDSRVADLPAWVPLLGDALVACDGMIVNVEIKNDPGEPGYDSSGTLAESVVQALAGYEARAIVSSFDLKTLDCVRSANSDIETGFLGVLFDSDGDGGVAEVPAARGHGSRGTLESLAARGHGWVNPHHLSVNGDFVERAHELGLGVAAWTVDDVGRMWELASWGVDVIITNELEAAIEALHG